MTDQERQDAMNITHAQHNDIFICVEKKNEYTTVGKEYPVVGMSFGNPVLEVDSGNFILTYHDARYFKLKPKRDLEVIVEKLDERPRGIKPEWLHDEHRFLDLSKVIQRFASAEREIDPIWVDEYNRLHKKISERQEQGK